MKLKRFFAFTLAVALTFNMTSFAYATPDIGNDEILTHAAAKNDNKPDPLTTRQKELKERAIKEKINGKAKGKTHEVARNEYVELKREGDGAIWTVLGEFSDYKHNEMITEPNRQYDNSTLWMEDFSREYYLDLLFSEEPGANSMRNFYLEQSSGRYSVHGDVTEWIQVPGTAASYDDNPDSNTWKFLVDSVDGWYEKELENGMTLEEINEYLKDFDIKDRYDYDHDGNFDEPDGYIDTFQSVHAGEGEDAGGGILGDKAIWSHSWYAYYNLDVGPEFNKLGGFQVGNSNYWIGKYTIQPENGGVGVFAHEYAHDMGLPDLYDYYGENGYGFWTLMASGSWLSDGTVDIGSKPGHMGAWEKLQLGWLNYDIASYKGKSLHTLGPMEFNTKEAQGLIVPLPKKTVITNLGNPYAGSSFYYSGTGDGIDNFMYKEVLVPSSATLSAKVNYQIELDWDYAYVIASNDGGITWKSINTNLSTDLNPNGQNRGFGITGESNGWVDLTADLSDYTDENILIGFRYWTDEATSEPGIMIDDINITGFQTDGAESDNVWTFNGFIITDGVEEGEFDHYYVAEYRTYEGFDSTLKTGPYQFGYLNKKKNANLVDHFAYQDGLLINYWDTSQKDNNTGLHPGKGLLLPIDAHPETLYRVDRKPWRNRIQTYDSTFSLSATDGIPYIHINSKSSPVESLPGVSIFDDNISYYDETNPLGSVMNPHTGTKIVILNEITKQFPYMNVEVIRYK